MGTRYYWYKIVWIMMVKSFYDRLLLLKDKMSQRNLIPVKELQKIFPYKVRGLIKKSNLNVKNRLFAFIIKINILLVFL